jgi:hypothetical protein
VDSSIAPGAIRTLILIRNKIALGYRWSCSDCCWTAQFIRDEAPVAANARMNAFVIHKCEEYLDLREAS